MKKIIHVLLLSNMGPSKNKPNSGRFVMNQYLALKKFKELELDFFYLDQEKKIGLKKLFRYPLFFVRFLLKYIFSTKKVDIIHVHFYFPNILLAIIYKFLRNWNVKVVVTFHGSDIYSYSSPNFLYKACIDFVDKSIFVSKKLEERFFKKLTSSVLSAGVDDIFYQSAKAINLDEKKFDVVFVGHLDKNKGIERLEEILINFPCKMTVAIIGAGNDDFIERAKNNSNISISYFESCTPEQLTTIYSSSYLLINLSYNESFGLVISEAMACGALVVATETDGACSQIVNGHNGYLISNDDRTICSSAINIIRFILSFSDVQYSEISKRAMISSEKHRLSTVSDEIFNIYAALQVKKINDK